MNQIIDLLKKRGFIIETKMPGNSGFFGPNAGIV